MSENDMLFRKGMSMIPVIAGIDEAGRGALAGPVVAAACVFASGDGAPMITDSKVLTPLAREAAFAYLMENSAYGVGMCEASIIDDIGILAATEKAMQEAVTNLSATTQPTYLLIDGRDHFWFDIPHSSIIRGDTKEKCIAAASIIAKVTRDRLMAEADTEYAGYGFPAHKGYGTQEHFTALQRKGICRLHRRTFLRNLVLQTPSGAFSG